MYNGHKNYNYWNVALWLQNDEGLYRMAKGYLKKYNKDKAAKMILNELKELNIDKTPDGAPYTISSIRAAITDL